MSRQLTSGVIGRRKPQEGEILIAQDTFNVADGVYANKQLDTGQYWDKSIYVNTLLTHKWAARDSGNSYVSIDEDFDFDKKIIYDIYSTASNAYVGGIISYTDVSNLWFITFFGTALRLCKVSNGSIIIIAGFIDMVSGYGTNIINDISFEINNYQVKVNFQNNEVVFTIPSDDEPHFDAGRKRVGMALFGQRIKNFRVYKI